MRRSREDCSSHRKEIRFSFLITRNTYCVLEKTELKRVTKRRRKATASKHQFNSLLSAFPIGLLNANYLMHHGHLTTNTPLNARRMPPYFSIILLAKEPMTNTFMAETGIYLRILLIYLLLFIY